MGMADLNFAPTESPAATLSICPTAATIPSDESEDEEGQPLFDCSSEEHLKCGGLFPCPVGDCIGKVDIDELFSHVLFIHKIDIQYATKRMYAEAREKFQKQTKLRKEALYLPSSDDDSSFKEKVSYPSSSEDEYKSKNKTLYIPSSEDESTNKKKTLDSQSDSDSDNNEICDCPGEECTSDEHNCPICDKSKNIQTWSYVDT